ncbi:MAG: FMN-binding protein, partial [Sarcina sp.]
GSSPEEFEPEFEKQIVEAQSSEIDGVTGATSSSKQAKEMVTKALENAKEGKTEVTAIEISK